MNKYDFGYDLQAGSTIEWAFDLVPKGSRVLELGPSNGNLVYHLKHDKCCEADIVEIDEEAGIDAARYARTSCIGNIEGNLERREWYEKLKGNSYDYIIVLDVLEHIRNPEEVLVLLNELLCDDGKILLSIPNIAHNSVIMKLLTNSFDYTSVGLLDDTHVHFYTYSTVQSMLKRSGLSIQNAEARKIKVGFNEIDVQYGQLPREVEAYLKVRPLQIAYQFLIVAGKKCDVSTPVPLYYEDDREYETCVIDPSNGDLLVVEKVNPSKGICISFDVEGKYSVLRLDPLDVNCILSNVSIIGYDDSGESEELKIEAFTGNLLGDKFVFYHDDPQIYITIPENIGRIKFSAQCDAFDSTALTKLEDMRDEYRLLQANKVELQSIIAEKERLIGRMDCETKCLCQENELLNTQITEVQMQNEAHLKLISQLQNEAHELRGELASNERTIQDMRCYSDEIEAKKEKLHDILEWISSKRIVKLLYGKQMRDRIEEHE